ncbi:hypothetical protein N0V88_004895 [Collariella sp. IMI 366227]|nr:hypothetical protein N0V88_004895 [Collariella sp. IMI 366227]
MSSKHNSYAPGHAASQTAVSQNPSLTLLDIGAGSGTISASLAKYLLQGHVLATDISDSILARAKEYADSQGVTNISFQKASVYELPFEDSKFDVVHAHQVLCHLDSPVEAVKEMLRVVKPGGLLALREWDPRMWCFWPETKGLLEYQELMVAVMLANGGQDKAGRRLVSWVMGAGVERERIEASFGTWCYSKPEDRRAWGNSMIERLRDGPLREKGIELGLTTEKGVEEMIKAWEEWIETSDATLGIMNGEIVAKKAVV